jgi:hypothetical protein
VRGSWTALAGAVSRVAPALNSPISIARTHNADLFAVNAGSNAVLRTLANTQQVVPFATGFTAPAAIRSPIVWLDGNDGAKQP